MRLADPALDHRINAALDAYCSHGTGVVGVAVSGGSDSLALLWFAHRWATANKRRILGLTVDHGLRPEAAEEAAIVARHCQRLGIAHQILTWVPPDHGATQARARRARHARLASAVRDAGGMHLLLGHTFDDQIETVAMRKRAEAKGPGLAGMRSIAPSPVWPAGRGVALVRPLLATRRADLQTLLTIKGWSWIDDPSNQNQDHERVRVRGQLASDTNRFRELETLVSSMGNKRSGMDRRLAEWLGTVVHGHPDGTIRFDQGSLDEDDLAEGLAILLMAAGGTDRRAPFEARRELAADILSGDWRARTLGGAWIALRQGKIIAARDPGEAAKAPEITPGFNGVWDGRFLIASESAATRYTSTWRLGDAAAPMARESLPKGLTSTQLAHCLIEARLEMTKYLLEQDSLTL
ncbi:MAG: tRNA lysidine(34) synthetase TilS [Pseudomonadota bacterium]